MPDVANIPQYIWDAKLSAGKYVIVEDGKIVMQTYCIHDARFAARLNRSLWRLSHLGGMPPTQIC